MELQCTVETNAQFIIGGWMNRTFFWGCAAGPASATPRNQFNLNSSVSDLGMTFCGAYSVVIVSSGCLSLYASDADSDQILWSLSLY